MSGDEVAQLKTQIAVMTERMDTFMTDTTGYRKSLCRKLDEMNARLINLPCGINHEKHKQYEEGIKANENHIKALWGFIGAIVMVLITKYIEGK